LDAAVHAAGHFISSHLGVFLRRWRFFARPIAFAVVLLEKNATWRARLGDYSTALEYEMSHVLRRIRDGEEKPIFLISRLYEESYY
jgi:hypothetical protein